MLHAVDRAHRFGVGGFLAGGDAAPLIDRHVDDHRSRPHLLHQCLVHQGGGAVARQQHGADQQIGRGHETLQQAAAAHQAHQTPLALALQAPQALRAVVEQQHLRIHGGRQPGGVPADAAGAEHHHPCRPYTGAASDQDPPAAVGLLQQVGAHLSGQPPGDLAHRRQQGQAAVVELHRFVGDGGGACRQQGAAHRRVGGQVQVGEQHQVWAKEIEFLRLRLLDLHHQVSGPGLLPAHQQCAGRGEGLVVEAGATAGPGLDPHREAMAHQLTYGIGRQRHPLLITFDLPRYADACDRGCRGGHGAGHGRFSSLAPLPVKSQG